MKKLYKKKQTPEIKFYRNQDQPKTLQNKISKTTYNYDYVC